MGYPEDVWDEAAMKAWFQNYGPPPGDPTITLSAKRREQLIALSELAKAPARAHPKSWWSAVAAGGAAAVLGIAWWLSPSTSGTHPLRPVTKQAGATSTFPVTAPFASGSIYVDSGIPTSRDQFITVSASPGTVLYKEEALMALQPPAQQQVWVANGRPPIYESTRGLYYFYQNPQPKSSAANDWGVTVVGQSGAPWNAKEVYLVGDLRAGALTRHVLAAHWFGQPLNGPRTRQTPVYESWPLAAPGTILGKEELLMMGQPRAVYEQWVAANLPSIVPHGSAYAFPVRGRWITLTHPQRAKNWPWYGRALVNGAN